jgi:hypothetical protein
MPRTAKASVEQWRDLVAAAAGRLEVWYLLGLMDRLSGGRADFEGSMGGRGLFQIHPTTAERLGLDPGDLWEPNLNTQMAAQLLATRAQEINAKDPQMVLDRPADLTLLTTGSYLWGPGIILPALQPGDTAAEVFSRLDPDIGEFAADVIARGQAYQDQPGDLVPFEQDTDAGPAAEGPSFWRVLAWVVGLPLMGVGVWFVVDSFRNKDAG